MTTSRVSQLVTVNVLAPLTRPRVSQLVGITVYGDIPPKPRVSQLVSIAVVGDGKDYLQLKTVFKFPCWQPCASYGTYVTVLIYN